MMFAWLSFELLQIISLWIIQSTPFLKDKSLSYTRSAITDFASTGYRVSPIERQCGINIFYTKVSEVRSWG